MLVTPLVSVMWCDKFPHVISISPVAQGVSGHVLFCLILELTQETSLSEFSTEEIKPVCPLWHQPVLRLLSTAIQRWLYAGYGCLRMKALCMMSSNLSHFFSERYLTARNETAPKFDPSRSGIQVKMNYPPKFDWRDRGIVGPVRNQESVWCRY